MAKLNTGLVSKEILQDFYIKLSKEYKQINEINYSKGEGTKYSREYYDYLKRFEVPYASVAYDVVINTGFFGRIANIHLERQGVFDGVSYKALEDKKANIVISLAYRDIKIRINKGSVSYEDIAKYHLKEFGKQGLTAYAWGGTVFEKLIGTGSWMTFHDIDQALKIFQLQKAEYIDGLSIPRLVDGIKDSFSVYAAKNYCSPDFEIRINLPRSIEDIAKIYDVDVRQVKKVPNVAKNSNSSNNEDQVFLTTLYENEYLIVGKEFKENAHIDEHFASMRTAIANISYNDYASSTVANAVVIDNVKDILATAFSSEVQEKIKAENSNIKALLPDVGKLISSYSADVDEVINILNSENQTKAPKAFTSSSASSMNTQNNLDDLNFARSLTSDTAESDALMSKYKEEEWFKNLMGRADQVSAAITNGFGSTPMNTSIGLANLGMIMPGNINEQMNVIGAGLNQGQASEHNRDFDGQDNCQIS